jgi:hypothetical protein
MELIEGYVKSVCAFHWLLVDEGVPVYTTSYQKIDR